MDANATSARRRVPWAISLTRSPRAPIEVMHHRREDLSSFKLVWSSARSTRCLQAFDMWL